VDVDRNYFNAHKRIFDRLGVNYDLQGDMIFCRFTEAQARGFMLLHVFIHELGHHHDHMNQKHRGSTRGEDYAEHFANTRFDVLHRAYVKVFGDPTKGD
jgi:hypothetical protein